MTQSFLMPDYFADIKIKETIIIGSIRELSSTSAAAPNVVTSSLLNNCAADLAQPESYCSPSLLHMVLFLNHLKELPCCQLGIVRSSKLWSTSLLLHPSGRQCRHSGGVCPQIQG